MLPRHIFYPLAVVRKRRYPERHLVELASEVYERDREACFAAIAFKFGWEDGRAWLCLAVAVWAGAVAKRTGDDGTHAGFVCCDDVQQLERSRLQQRVVRVLGSYEGRT
jgi:hypothetical protein